MKLLAPPIKRIVESRITHNAEGTSLIDFLVARFTYQTREAWSQAVESGYLTLNGSGAPPQTILACGDHLQWDATDIAEPPAALDFHALLHTDDLMVVDKPANLPVHPAGPYFNHTLWALLRRHTGLEQLHIVTRLDRETSGLVLVACKPEAAAHFHRQLAQHALHKRYLAILEGAEIIPQNVRGYLSRGKTDGGALRMELSDLPTYGAKETETRFNPIETSPEKQISLVEAIPITGRLHQIRASAAAIGHPVVGDKLYGPDPTIYDRFRLDKLTADDHRHLRLNRQALHASELTFLPPGRSDPLTLRAPLPSELKRLLQPDM